VNPDLNWWARLGAILAVETALIVAVAKCLALRWGSATERQFIWRAAVIGLIGVFCGELVGVRPDRWIRSEPLNPRELQWTVQQEKAPAAPTRAPNYIAHRTTRSADGADSSSIPTGQ
jgi:hypothetical protein